MRPRPGPGPGPHRDSGSLSPSGTRRSGVRAPPPRRGPGRAGERGALCAPGGGGRSRQVGPRRALPSAVPARPPERGRGRGQHGLSVRPPSPRTSSAPSRSLPPPPPLSCPRRPRLPMETDAPQPGLASPDSPHDPWYRPAQPARPARPAPAPAPTTWPIRVGPGLPGARARAPRAPAPGAHAGPLCLSSSRSKMFIGGLSWQTTQGERARAPPAAGHPDPAPERTPSSARARLTPAPCALLRAPPGTPRARGDRRARTAQRVEGRRRGARGAPEGGLGPRDPPAAAPTPLAPAAQTFVRRLPERREPTGVVPPPALHGPRLPGAPMGARSLHGSPVRAQGWGWGCSASAQAAGRGGGGAAPGSPGAKDGGGGGRGAELVRRRVCGYRRAARILWPVRGGEGVSGDAGPPDQEIQVSPSPAPPAPAAPPPSTPHPPPPLSAL